MKKWIILLITAAVVLSIAGCANIFGSDDGGGNDDPTGDAELSINLQGMSDAGYLVDRVDVTLTNVSSGDTESAELTVDTDANSASGTVTGIGLGEWAVEAKLFEDGTQVGTGSGTVTVTGDSTASATLQVSLDQATGSVSLEIDLTGFVERTAEVQTLQVGNNTVFLPSSFSVGSQPSGDFTGSTVEAGNSGEVAGFAAETDSGGASDASGVGSNDQSTLNTGSGGGLQIQTLTLIGSSVSGDTYTGRYNLTVSPDATPSEVRNLILTLIGKTTSGGSVSGLPSAGNASPATDFRMVLTVKFFSGSVVVKTLIVTPQSAYGTYEADIIAFSDGTNIAPSGSTLATKEDTFTAQGGGGKADFLFVVDNSGSMGDEQDEISAVATDFWSELSSSGLDFEVGVITTDSSSLRGSGFTSDQTTFETDVKPGTSGSASEAGIYHAEEALQSGGSVTQAGYPRSGASLSVIVLSDEDSQYTSYSSGTFDPASNLFLDNGYRFYSIIDESDAGQYDDLSNETGGTVASITDKTAFPQIMQTIATDAGGLSSQYTLTEQAIVNATMTVVKNGSTVPKSTTDGWSYNVSTNSVIFYGNAVPSAGDTVGVIYAYVK